MCYSDASQHLAPMDLLAGCALNVFACELKLNTIGYCGNEILYGPPRNREIVFRVRVVLDVRAKLSASHPDFLALAPTRGPAASVLVVSRWCPGDVPVVSRLINCKTVLISVIHLIST